MIKIQKTQIQKKKNNQAMCFRKNIETKCYPSIKINMWKHNYWK